MTILFVTPHFPWPLNTGGNLRAFHLLQILARKHPVVLLSLEEASADHPFHEMADRTIALNTKQWQNLEAFRHYRPFASLPRRLHTFATTWTGAHAACLTTPRLVAEIGRFVQEIKPEFVWAYRSHTAELMRRVGCSKVINDTVDLVADYELRQLRTSKWYPTKPLHALETAKLAAYEHTLRRRFSRVVVCKDADRERLGGGRNVFVVPNGFSPVPAITKPSAEPMRMLYVGAFDYEPNSDAVKFFARDILPTIQEQLPEAEFQAIGKNSKDVRLDSELKSLAGTQIEFDVPSVEPYYEHAAIIVCPLRLGAGTKLKVLEALFRAKALVATSVAVEGLDLRPGIDYEHADSAADFARICVQLLQDPNRQQQLGMSGRERVIQRFTWDAIAPAVDRVLS